MRYICVTFTIFIFSSVCLSQTSPDIPSQTPSITSPSSPNTPTQNIQTQLSTSPYVPIAIHTTSGQSPNIISNEDIKIARTELERDAYKQALDAYQRSFENIKWILMFTAPFILAFIGYIGIKNYTGFKEVLQQAKEARDDAKKACEKAELWEEKARNTCDEIETMVKNKLVEIEKASEQKAQQALNLIDKKAEAKLKNIGEKTQKSTQEIDIKTINQMRITELWSDAVRLDKEGAYAKACEKYAEVVNINPKLYQVYRNWGNVLDDWAKLKGNEEYFKDACGKYAKAIEIKPDDYDSYNSWCATILDWAKFKKGTSEYYSLLNQAEEKALKAESLKKGEGTYNLACVYALRDNKQECRKWLLSGQEAGLLESRDYAMNDIDFDSVKNEQWFREIKWKGE